MEVLSVDNKIMTVNGKLAKRQAQPEQRIWKRMYMTQLVAVELFPHRVIKHAYVINERLQYKNILYRIVQAYTSQIDWMSDIVGHRR